MTNPAVYTSLHQDQRLVEAKLQHLLSGSMPERGPVLEAMRYAVLGTGQRLRPMIAVRVGRLLGSAEDATTAAAASVELFHCASLIVDDLPCMDNADSRRDRPSVHVAYGQSTAVLAAFGLVALAARAVIEPDCPFIARRQCFQLQLLRTLDVEGLLAGQALDLLLSGDTRDRNRTRMTELKTVPLFELSVRAGLMCADASPQEQACLLRFGRLFGLAYQALDDVLDGELDGALDVEAAFEAAAGELAGFGSNAVELRQLITYLHGKLKTDNRGHR